MEVRCSGCNKLFRVADDKITGNGIKFGCTRCGDIVKITRQDFEQYQLSEAAAALPDMLALPVQAAPKAAAAMPPASRETAASAPAFDLALPADDTAALPQEEEAPPVFVKPAVREATKPSVAKDQPSPRPQEPPAARPAPGPAPVQQKPPVKEPPIQRPEPVRPAAPVSAPPAAASPAREAARPAPVVLDAAPVQSAGSGLGKMTAFIVIALLVVGGIAFGVKFYLGQASQRASDAAKGMTSPDGLQIQNASGAIDPAKGDLVITGVIENTTDKPRPAWYVVVDVYNAQNAVLTKGKLLNGKQLYTKRDLEILAKRGVNIPELKKSLQEQGVTIPARASVNFEIRILEPPVGVASFNATLQPFDPVQLYKEIAEEQT
ncbi:MAG TPA: zinc-ribbon domain-containing protein [Nitrospirota bacterium]|nr:zinc-ribbon domain-containing protein [Nitrospirota bacterium]